MIHSQKKNREKTNVNTCRTETHALPGLCEWASRRHERRHVCHWSWSNSWRPSWISFSKRVTRSRFNNHQAFALWLSKVISWNHALFQRIDSFYKIKLVEPTNPKITFLNYFILFILTFSGWIHFLLES